MRISVSKDIIGLDKIRHQVIIWTNAGLLLHRPLGTIFNGIQIEINQFSFKKID